MAIFMSVTASAQKKKTTAAKPATAKAATAAPTKAETMDWIAGKMKENLRTGFEFVSFTNGVFEFTFEENYSPVTITLDLNKITGMSNEYSEEVTIMGKKALVTKRKGYDDRPFNEIGIAGPNYSENLTPFNFTPDKPLVERMKKALTTLIAFNTAGAKKADEKF